MCSNEIYVGKWVKFKEGKKEFTGFVVGIKHFESEARVAVPKLRKTKTVPFFSIKDYEEPTIDSEQIDAMIDVALDTRDFEWVKELLEQKGALENANEADRK
ncbi:hypothetical protein [Terrihalobacillus insolitus]|uniref:hypothetical protein n=1 Tax=Terrihalobacillus insolitus TaxID=2950438 RepID=UPI002341E7BD|nr:hypothetical protein [Terrihalobacillus insolitus]MDC3413931.1 hypothetical protein [Terrihalobacillus insolitus]